MVVSRIGVSLEGALLEDFDGWVRSHGFRSRSDALRQLVRQVLAKGRVAAGGDVVGTITYVYRHDSGTVTHRILHRQHDFLSSIRATAHTHLNEEVCLEVLLVQGKTARIEELADRLRTAKGVLFQETVLTTPELR